MSKTFRINRHGEMQKRKGRKWGKLTASEASPEKLKRWGKLEQKQKKKGSDEKEEKQTGVKKDGRHKCET